MVTQNETLNKKTAITSVPSGALMYWLQNPTTTLEDAYITYANLEQQMLRGSKEVAFANVSATSVTATGVGSFDSVNANTGAFTTLTLDNGASDAQIDNKVSDVLRFRQYYDSSASLYRVENYDATGTVEAEIYRIASGVFNVNPNNSDVDFNVEVPNGLALSINSGGNLVGVNPSNADIDFSVDTISTNNALFVNAGSNNVQIQVPLLIGSGAAPRILSGSGSPEGAQSAVVGSLFLRTDGGASTTLYVKESGSGNTGWVAK